MRLLEQQTLLNNYYITRHTSVNVNLTNGHGQRPLLPKNDSLKPVICLPSLMNGPLYVVFSAARQDQLTSQENTFP